MLARQLRSALLLLVVTATISFFLGDRTDAAIIGVILVVSVGLGLANEYRAEKAAETLHSQMRHEAVVRRAGRAETVEVRDQVPGDVDRLAIGQILPADRLAERSSCAFMGMVVRSGQGEDVVVATGPATEFGAIAAGLGERQGQTEFQVGLRRFSVLLVQVAGVLTGSIFAVNGVLHRPVLDSLLFSLAIAIGLTPQLLPAVVTTSLAAGSRRLAARGDLVKRLVCIEDLGDIQVLPTDKTGTLTEGEISFARAVDPHGRETAGGDLPFDHVRRLSSVLVDDPAAGRIIVTKGAPEAVRTGARDAPRSGVTKRGQSRSRDASSR